MLLIDGERRQMLSLREVARLDMGDTHAALESVMPLILEFSRAPQMIHLASRDELFLPGRHEGGFMQVGFLSPFQTRNMICL